MTLAIVIPICFTICFIAHRCTWMGVETDKNALEYRAIAMRLELERERNLLSDGRP